MPSIVMSADSVSLILNGFPVLDFTEGDFLELNPVNPLTSHINSANGGVNINERSDGGVYDLVFRVQKYSVADVFLNSAGNQKPIAVFNGSVKEDYSRDGTDGVESYLLENGSITTRPGNTKNNQDGNASMEYTLRFRNVVRSI